MISLSHRFIFIHVPKTAGTALTEALQPYARPEPRTLYRRLLRRLPVTQSVTGAYFRQHDTAAQIRATLTPEVFDSFHSFGVVRNPFDHAVSYYEFMKEYRSRRHARLARTMSFAQHLEHRLRPRHFHEKPFLRLPNQSFYLCDASGRVLVTEVLRFETLEEDLANLAGRLGLTVPPLGRARQSRFRDPGRSLSAYYEDPRAVDLVRRLYAPDFAAFGYPPDPPAAPWAGLP